MFLSGVKSTSDSARFDKDKRQMNDLIMGPRDAIYLAAFITALHKEYTTLVNNKQGSDSSKFDRCMLEKALKQKLDEFEVEDRGTFGR